MVLIINFSYYLGIFHCPFSAWVICCLNCLLLVSDFLFSYFIVHVQFSIVGFWFCLSIVGFLLNIENFPLSIVLYTFYLSVISYTLYNISFPFSTTDYPWSIVLFTFSVIYCPLKVSFVRCPLLGFHVKSPLSIVSCLVYIFHCWLSIVHGPLSLLALSLL